MSIHPTPRSPWSLGGLSLLELGRRVWREVGKDEITDRAASLSYYFLFALFPALLFLTALFGLLSAPSLMDDLLYQIDQVLPRDAASLLRRTIQEVVGGARGSFLSVGVLGTLWAASNGMASIMRALNKAYSRHESRAWWRRRLDALGLTLLSSLMVLSALVLLGMTAAAGAGLAERAGLGPEFGVAREVLRWVAGPLAGLLGVGLVYRLAPGWRRRGRWVTPGSVFAVAAWLALSYGLREYVERSADYNAIYGSIGGVVLLLLWLYLSALTLLVGAEIDSAIDQAQAEASREEEGGEHGDQDGERVVVRGGRLDRGHRHRPAAGPASRL